LNYLLGNAYWEAGRTTEAADHWRQTLTLQPQHPDRVRMLEHLQSLQETQRR